MVVITPFTNQRRHPIPFESLRHDGIGGAKKPQKQSCVRFLLYRRRTITAASKILDLLACENSTFSADLRCACAFCGKKIRRCTQHNINRAAANPAHSKGFRCRERNAIAVHDHIAIILRYRAGEMSVRDRKARGRQSSLICRFVDRHNFVGFAVRAAFIQRARNTIATDAASAVDG